MSDILLILCVLYVLKALLTTSLMPRPWAWIGFAAVCAGFVWLSHGFALQQNKLTLEAMFEGRQILTDVSIVIMLDLMLTLAFCRSALNRNVGIPQKRILKVMGYVPPLLMFPVLYYAQVNMFFSFTGVDFLLLTGILSAAALLLMTAGTVLAKKLLPDPDLRIELTALLELLLLLLSVFVTIFHPSTIMYSHDAPLDYRTLLFSLGVLASLLAAGYGWHFLWERRQRPRRINGKSLGYLKPHGTAGSADNDQKSKTI